MLSRTILSLFKLGSGGGLSFPLEKIVWKNMNVFIVKVALQGWV